MESDIAHVQAWLPTDPPRPAPELMTADEAALYLRVRPRTVQQWSRAGRIRCVRVGRLDLYPLEELRRFWNRLLL